MATTNSPVLCVTCRQPVPEDVKQLDYFAQTSLKPEADDVENFLAELRDLTHYLESLFILLVNADKSALDDDRLYNCFSLGWSLASEAWRRVELADAACDLQEKRLKEAEAGNGQTAGGKEG
jgi:hypothetical protein